MIQAKRVSWRSLSYKVTSREFGSKRIAPESARAEWHMVRTDRPTGHATRTSRRARLPGRSSTVRCTLRHGRRDVTASLAGVRPKKRQVLLTFLPN